MLIIPAIDIRGGRVVRLVQGDFHQETVYHDDPVKVAKRWEGEGARLLHIVDLDGAREGEPVNLELVGKIASEVDIPIQMGGGVRSLETVREVLSKGIRRVILGTQASAAPDLVREACQEFGKRVAIGIDVKDGLVAVRGWTELTSKEAVTLAREMENLEVRTIIFTDVRRDGMLTGPGVKSLEEILQGTNVSLIASGGISSLEDVRRLKRLEREGLEGIIIGKALYEGRIEFGEAIAVA
ncbi:1-(5-phosphoribosyl)-5-[(5-phosphoribosylamino)methylideneamino]imidazole-4-carboxamide isomerase [candidate division NPL-UPA2 bacterium]|nr:1-(5-phosphoribosyl)-5-[(5-phosphoribosylamino)methylideneamino]imidazole-4-carboxamide isomerase [candidate division NPL-UPA2 bacterium]